MSELEPFGPAAGTDLGDLHLETDPDEFVISGSLSIRRDPQGLRDVRRLKAILRAAEEVISASPSETSGDLPTVTRPNPFGP